MSAAAVILAGGHGRRMGGAIKSLLPVGDATVLDRQVAALAAAGIDELALSVAREAPGALLAAAARLRLAVVPDGVADRGPLGGILAALTWSPLPVVLAVAGDLPELQPLLLTELVRRAARADAVVPRIAGEVEPLVAAYGVACAPVIESRLRGERRRARELPAALVARGLAVDFVEESALTACDPDLRSFRNWNRPADLP